MSNVSKGVEPEISDNESIQESLCDQSVPPSVEEEAQEDSVDISEYSPTTKASSTSSAKKENKASLIMKIDLNPEMNIFQVEKEESDTAPKAVIPFKLTKTITKDNSKIVRSRANAERK